MLFATLEALSSDMKKPEKEFSMLISKKTRKKLTVSALVAAPVAMTSVGADVVSADTVHTPDKTQNTVSTNSATSSANSSAASSATSSAASLTASASVASYRTVVVQPDSAMTSYLKQAAANGMKGEMVATITDGIHNKGDNTSDSTVTVNDGGSVTVTLADADTLAGTVTTTFSNGMILTSTITNGKMSTQVTTEPTSGSASSATSSAASSSGNDSFSDAVSIYGSAASSDAGSTASDSASRDYHAASSMASESVLSNDYERYEAVSSASSDASSTPSDASDSTTSNTNVTAFTLKYKNSDYAQFSMNQSLDSLYSNVSSLLTAAINAGLYDSPYYEMLSSAHRVGGELFDASTNDGQLTDDQKAELINDAYQLARQIADKDSNYTLSDVNDDDPSNGGGNDYDNDGGDYGDDTTDGDNNNESSKTLPQAGEEDTSSMSIAGMAMAGAVTLAGMVGKMRKRQKVRNEDD